MAVLIPCRGGNLVNAQSIEVDPEIITTTEGDEPLEPGAGDSEEEETPEQETPEQETEPLFAGFQISTTVIADEYLYSALLNLYKDTYRGTDKAYSGSTIYSDMFKDFTDITLDSANITSLRGLDKLELDSLKSFSANRNYISDFSSEYFVNAQMDNIERLSLACNELKSIDLTDFERLKYVDLSSNQLEKVDLSMVEGVNTIVNDVIVGADIEINVANNKLDEMKDIVLPDKRIEHITLNVIDNNITVFEDKYFTNDFTMKIGVQGYKPKDKDDKERKSSDTLSNLKIYRLGIEGLAVQIYKVDGQEDELIDTISDEDITGNYQQLRLPVGEYEYIYTIDGQPAFSRNDEKRAFLDSYKFWIIPQLATYNFTYKGKDYDTLNKVTGKVTVNLFTAEEGAKIFYSVNNAEWVEGSTVVCDKGGNYSIKVKTVINGVESEEQSVWVRTSLNLYISDAVMLVLVVLLTLALFFVVLPIISKKYFKKD